MCPSHINGVLKFKTHHENNVKPWAYCQMEKLCGKSLSGDCSCHKYNIGLWVRWKYANKYDLWKQKASRCFPTVNALNLQNHNSYPDFGSILHCNGFLRFFVGDGMCERYTEHQCGLSSLKNMMTRGWRNVLFSCNLVNKASNRGERTFHWSWNLQHSSPRHSSHMKIDIDRKYWTSLSQRGFYQVRLGVGRCKALHPLPVPKPTILQYQSTATAPVAIATGKQGVHRVIVFATKPISPVLSQLAKSVAKLTPAKGQKRSTTANSGSTTGASSYFNGSVAVVLLLKGLLLEVHLCPAQQSYNQHAYSGAPPNQHCISCTGLCRKSGIIRTIQWNTSHILWLIAWFVVFLYHSAWTVYFAYLGLGNHGA